MTGVPISAQVQVVEDTLEITPGIGRKVLFKGGFVVKDELRIRGVESVADELGKCVAEIEVLDQQVAKLERDLAREQSAMSNSRGLLEILEQERVELAAALEALEDKLGPG